MRPTLRSFAVVTATTNAERADPYTRSWIEHATFSWPFYCHENGAFGIREPYLGSVPAFAKGVQAALFGGAQVIACLHDDVRIDESGWDAKVLEYFDRHPQCGLLGFGGAVGLGSDDIYQTPYDPMQLARQGFRSNMQDAEAHGKRTTQSQRVACLDGFCQIGRVEFWQGRYASGTPKDFEHLGRIAHDLVRRRRQKDLISTRLARGNLFARMTEDGVRHHFYDGMLGCFAARLGWEVHLLPLACHHAGGLTAVGDAGYIEWAKTQDPQGDQGFWEQAHKIGYEEFRDVLPIRV